MLEHAIETLSSLPPWGIALAAFGITYLENLLPPSPSDVLLVFVGTLVGIGSSSFVVVLMTATLGSVTGFYTMFVIGRIFGDRLMQSRFGRYFPTEALARAEHWFQRWGYYVIVVNRFMSGTRSVISLFAGMSHLKPIRTIILCGVSALVWNWLLLYAGMKLGQNWRVVERYFETYGMIITVIITIAATSAIVHWVWRRRRSVIGK
ncbi:MAG: DedA family protein [Chlorobi bacterium]|nr:DedA family protein [Chlorobiota bacterium]